MEHLFCMDSYFVNILFFVIKHCPANIYLLKINKKEMLELDVKYILKLNC